MLALSRTSRLPVHFWCPARNLPEAWHCGIVPGLGCRLALERAEQVRGVRLRVRLWVLGHAAYCFLFAATFHSFLFFFFRSFFVERVRRRRTADAPYASKGEKAPSFALTAAEDLIIGMVAGAASRFFTTPLSNVTVRMQTSATAKSKGDAGNKGKENAKGKGKEQAKPPAESESDDEDEYGSGTGITAMMREILAEKGVAGLWAGYETAVLLSVTPALTFYLSHLFARAALPKSAQAKPSSWQTFLVNAAGNSTSTAILFPLILSKTRLQWKSPSGRRVYNSLLDVLRKTVRRSGVAGLYQGLESQLLKGLVSHGTTMVVKQRVEAAFVMLFLAVVQRQKRAQLSGGASA